jgi:hypothetical protein
MVMVLSTSDIYCCSIHRSRGALACAFNTGNNQLMLLHLYRFRRCSPHLTVHWIYHFERRYQPDKFTWINQLLFYRGIFRGCSVLSSKPLALLSNLPYTAGKRASPDTTGACHRFFISNNIMRKTK